MCLVQDARLPVIHGSVCEAHTCANMPGHPHSYIPMCTCVQKHMSASRVHAYAPGYTQVYPTPLHACRFTPTPRKAKGCTHTRVGTCKSALAPWYTRSCPHGQSGSKWSVGGGRMAGEVPSACPEHFPTPVLAQALCLWPGLQPWTSGCPR